MIGFILAFSSSIVSSSKEIVSKKLSSSISSSVSTFASFAYPLPLYVLLLLTLSACGVPVFSVSAGFWQYAIARALTDTGAEWCRMKALFHGELSVVTAFFSLYPMLLLISSPLLTGDPLEPGTPVAMAIIVAGTMVILYRPKGDAPISMKAVGLALLAAVFFSLNTALDRATVRQAHPVYSASIMTLFSAIFVSVTLRRGSYAELIKERKLFGIRGVLEVLFMTLKLSALQIVSAPILVGISRLSTVLNVLAGHYVFGEKHLARRLVGASLVCVGVTYMLLAK